MLTDLLVSLAAHPVAFAALILLALVGVVAVTVFVVAVALGVSDRRGVLTGRAAARPASAPDPALHVYDEDSYYPLPPRRRA